MEYEDRLVELFTELDTDGSGFLDNLSFCHLGEAITGEKVTASQAQAQLDRADKDGDGLVSKQEFIEFSEILYRLDEYTFLKMVTGCIEKVKIIKARKSKRIDEETKEIE